MGHRLSRIVTRTGDDGSTGLADGRRLPKHHVRITALGEVDELNGFLGLLLSEPMDAALRALLTEIQNDLFDLGAELALPQRPQVDEAHVARLDEAIAAYNAALPPLKEFVLPGGSRAAALAHVCRSVCRRAERSLTRLQAEEPVSPQLLRYLNRLSDLLFVLARSLNRAAGQPEPCWRGPSKT
ncbi:MAG: cob(I)yrinic acid a,c-diamide adenosyltransferase [Thiobacillaceae bacterium]|nr:cob(I)yrinic acid a,c-diamide adenosyltransferase [Thiobacillaceae bacterium]MCX7673923.1 cob(I)yrinic acid a,c-diamide adenosyltransferase [Thiobacillaceae bacterium]MDW8322467.1 cob(I)yrinic acid a,c-diamide adenosyltransferase [Burkholderiales bacterium]